MIFVVAVFGLTACSDNSKEAKCTVSEARELSQAFITNSKFDVTCIKTTKDKAFFFVSNDDASHTVTTADGDPEKIDAELPKKDSVFSHSFSKTGTYHITCKRHEESMTLIVTD